jgi:hypothetical protein
VPHHHLCEWFNPSTGCTFSFACGPLSKQRYINPKLERELIDFRREVEAKHAKAETARYRFPRRELHAENTATTAVMDGAARGTVGNEHLKIKEYLRQENITQIIRNSQMRRSQKR